MEVRTDRKVDGLFSRFVDFWYNKEMKIDLEKNKKEIIHIRQWSGFKSKLIRA